MESVRLEECQFFPTVLLVQTLPQGFERVGCLGIYLEFQDREQLNWFIFVSCWDGDRYGEGNIE